MLDGTAPKRTAAFPRYVGKYRTCQLWTNGTLEEIVKSDPRRNSTAFFESRRGIGDSVQHKPVKTLLIEEGLMAPEEERTGHLESSEIYVVWYMVNPYTMTPSNVYHHSCGLQNC